MRSLNIIVKISAVSYFLFSPNGFGIIFSMLEDHVANGVLGTIIFGAEDLICLFQSDLASSGTKGNNILYTEYFTQLYVCIICHAMPFISSLSKSSLPPPKKRAPLVFENRGLIFTLGENSLSE